MELDTATKARVVRMKNTVNRGVPRLFNVLFCALLVGLTSLPAWAIARPETRVGGSPDFSPVFAATETAKPVEPPQENPGCGYDFASGLHKYLYCQDDPVDNSDPSGKIPVVSNWLYGNEVHRLIGNDFTEYGTREDRHYDRPISEILHVPWIPVFTASKPDLVQDPEFGSPGQVYEIKP